MKKLAVLSITAFSLGSIYAADPQPPANSSKPFPPPEQMGRPNRGGHQMDRQRWKDRQAAMDGRQGMRPGQEGVGRPDHGGHQKDRQAAMDGHQGMRPGQEGMRGEGPGKPGRGKMLARKLNLTPEQKEKLKAIMEAAKPKIEAVRKEGHEKMKSVMEDSLKDLRPILTPEQQAVFDDLQKFRADKAALDAAQKPEKSKKPKDE